MIIRNEQSFASLTAGCTLSSKTISAPNLRHGATACDMLQRGTPSHDLHLTLLNCDETRKHAERNNEGPMRARWGPTFPERLSSAVTRDGSPRDGSPRDGSPRDGSPPGFHNVSATDNKSRLKTRCSCRHSIGAAAVPDSSACYSSFEIW